MKQCSLFQAGFNRIAYAHDSCRYLCNRVNVGPGQGNRFVVQARCNLLCRLVFSVVGSPPVPAEFFAGPGKPPAMGLVTAVGHQRLTVFRVTDMHHPVHALIHAVYLARARRRQARPVPAPGLFRADTGQLIGPFITHCRPGRCKACRAKPAAGQTPGGVGGADQSINYNFGGPGHMWGGPFRQQG